MWLLLNTLMLHACSIHRDKCRPRYFIFFRYYIFIRHFIVSIRYFIFNGYFTFFGYFIFIEYLIPARYFIVSRYFIFPNPACTSSANTSDRVKRKSLTFFFYLT